MNEFSFFATQGPLRPGAHAELFDSPADIGELCAVVQGVTVHPFWAERYGVTLAAERGAEVQLRTMEKRLARTLELDSRPLTVPRPLELKTVGNCRDHTLLLVSMLRSQGVPARARCGFGTYFLPGHFEDHWVAEYWNESEKRWILVDAQLDAFQRGVLNVSFDPLDVPGTASSAAARLEDVPRGLRTRTPSASSTCGNGFRETISSRRSRSTRSNCCRGTVGG